MQIKPQNNNSEVYKSTTDLNRVIKDVLELAKKEGATDAAVAVNYDRGFSVDVRMGEVETVAFSEDKGVGLTVYIDQRKGEQAVQTHLLKHCNLWLKQPVR